MIYSYELKELDDKDFQLEITRHLPEGQQTTSVSFPKSTLRDLVAMLNEYCLECGSHDPLGDEPAWHKENCSMKEE